MAHLYEHQDYRVWLAEEILRLQSSKPYLTYRYVAKKLAMNPAHWTRILQQKKHLAIKHLPIISQIFKFSAQEERYFEALIRFNRARSARDCQKYFLEMQSIRGIHMRTIEDARHEYFSSYRHVAMRTLLSIVPFQGKRHDRLGNLFTKPLTAEETRQSVELLERLGLVVKDSQGVFQAVDKVLSSGDGWMSEAVAAFQRETIQLSLELLDAIPRQDRDISTLTIPMSSKHLNDLRLKVRDFRQQLIQWVQTLEHEDSVYQINMQVFPVAQAPVRSGGSAS